MFSPRAGPFAGARRADEPYLTAGPIPGGKALLQRIALRLHKCALSCLRGGKGRFFAPKEAKLLEKRIGVIGIIVDAPESVARLNAALHEHAALIVGRMGVPYRERGVSVISLIVDGDGDEISALTGKLGRLTGVQVKAALAKA